MRNICIIALIFIGISAKAQYFQHIYGTPNPSRLTSGLNTVVQPQGHFLTGHSRSFCQPAISTIPAVYSDINGNVPGAPFFERDYMIISPTTGSILTARNSKGFELSNGSGFGIIGNYFDIANPGITGVFYLQLDPMGNPLATFDYPTVPGGGFTFNVVEVGGVTKAPLWVSPDEIFVTGTVIDNLGQNRIFAIDINSVTGAITWSQIYDILVPGNQAWGKDIAENPAIPMLGIAGMVNSNMLGPATDDAYFLHVDVFTGIPFFAPIFLYGTPASNEHFNSINSCAPGGFPPGFVMGGGTDVNGSVDFFVARMDMFIAPFFFNTFDFSMVPGSTNDCFDVIERLNTACQYELYAVGHTDNGPFGSIDVMAVKMDQFGNGVPGGEFIYGGANPDFGVKLDVLNIGPPCAPPPMPAPAGLSIFGTWGGPGIAANTDLYHIKSYYNGVSGCNELFNNPLQLPGFPVIPTAPVITLSTFSSANLLHGYSVMSDITLCFNPFIGTGNNNKVAVPDNANQQGPKPVFDAVAENKKPFGDDAQTTAPKPAVKAIIAHSADKTLKVKIDRIDGEAEVRVYDILGKEFLNGKYVVKGNSDFNLDISNAAITRGLYYVSIQQGDTKELIPMMIK